MEWYPEKPVPRSQKGGIRKRPYQKSKDAFLLDYKALIDYASRHRFDGVVIFGFLRDVHGGIRYSQELCRYAEDRDVGIMPGVGVYHYGGYFWEGNHRFNLATFLQGKPGLRALDKDGKRIEAVCPSKEGWQKWLRQGMRWLYETFEIKGVNVESNEEVICHCEDCKRAREEWVGDDLEWMKTDFLTLKPALETALEIDPSSWVSYATYIGFDKKIMESPPGFVKLLPDNAIAQWTLTYILDDWSEGARPPTKRSTALGHFNRKWLRQRIRVDEVPRLLSECHLSIIRNLCRRSVECGMEGALIYGEHPDSNVLNELNYLAFQDFSQNPGLSLEEFAEKRLTPLYGGDDAASDVMKIIHAVETRVLNMETVKENLRIAKTRLDSVSDREAYRRWGQIVTLLEELVHSVIVKEGLPPS